MLTCPLDRSGKRPITMKGPNKSNISKRFSIPLILNSWNRLLRITPNIVN